MSSYGMPSLYNNYSCINKTNLQSTVSDFTVKQVTNISSMYLSPDKSTENISLYQTRHNYAIHKLESASEMVSNSALDAGILVLLIANLNVSHQIVDWGLP